MNEDTFNLILDVEEIHSISSRQKVLKTKVKCEYIDFDGEEEQHRVEEQYRLEVGHPVQKNNILSWSYI